jgi:secreted PhoX family phosphatase
MAKASIRRLARPHPRQQGRFLDVSRRRLRQRRAPSLGRRRVPLLVLRTCEASFYFVLLEMGTLLAARFNDDGTGEWLPLTFGQDPLTTANGLASRPNIPINTRRATDPPGAIRIDTLDRLAASAINGKVCCAMAPNPPRTRERAAHMKRCRSDYHGQISACTEDNAGNAAEPFTWALFPGCASPPDGADSAHFMGLNPQLMRPVSSPHHTAFGLRDNLWIAAADQASASRMNDGLDAIPVVGSQCGLRQCLRYVLGGTIADLTFTPNNHPLFCSVQQHRDGSSLNDPSSTWLERAIPPRPNVIAVEKTDGACVIES